MVLFFSRFSKVRVLKPGERWVFFPFRHILSVRSPASRNEFLSHVFDAIFILAFYFQYFKIGSLPALLPFDVPPCHGSSAIHEMPIARRQRANRGHGYPISSIFLEKVPRRLALRNGWGLLLCAPLGADMSGSFRA